MTECTLVWAQAQYYFLTTFHPIDLFCRCLENIELVVPFVKVRRLIVTQVMVWVQTARSRLVKQHLR